MHFHNITTMACFASHHLDESHNVKAEYKHLHLESASLQQQNHTETELVDVAKMTADEVTNLLLDHGIAPLKYRQHEEL